MSPRIWACTVCSLPVPEWQNVTGPQHRKRVNSRQLMARLPWPTRQVGAVQLLGCRCIYFHDSGHEHKRPLLRPAYWKGCAALNLHKQCETPLQARERGSASD